MSEDRPKFPRDLVAEVFLEFAHRFDPTPAFECPHALADRVCAVGGFRRRKKEMKDLELLYVPRIGKCADAGDLFGAEAEVNFTEQFIEELRSADFIQPRHTEDGSLSAWGRWNKHAIHVATGLPIDLFTATSDSYFNRLVVTTGPRELNVRIAAAARTMGWEWEINSPGFVPLGGSWEACPKMRRTMRSEREVFDFVHFPYVRPEERGIDL